MYTRKNGDVFRIVNKKDVNKNDFSSSIEKLEDILRKLESGNVPLEKALELYSEGVKIVKHCEKSLETAEQKIVDISAISFDELKKEQEPAFSNDAR